MTPLLPTYYCETYLEHKTGLSHPESPARVEAIVKALQSSSFANQLEWRIPAEADRQQLTRVHPNDYVQAVEDLAGRGGGYLDPDTPISQRSFKAAQLAVGAWLDGAKTVLQTEKPALAICRPPGHHALPERGMGFCVFANAAIAGLWALEQPGIERVAIFDWDVHHGNGSQAIVEQHPRLAYASVHESPHYPWTGESADVGIHGNICNVPLPSGSDWPVYEFALTEKIFPFLRRMQPDLLLVSAGFDCAKGDPLAHMLLLPEDFGRMARLCLDLTPRTVFGLEGGYNLDNLARSWVSVAQACLERL